jgi:hypothetical protein
MFVAMCPYCGQNAPIVYRGVAAFCSACGRQRPALIAPSVSYAGKPSRVGGTVAGVAGWVVLGVGLFMALAMGLLLGIIHTPLGVVVGSLIALASIIVSVLLLVSGKKLRKSGDDAQKHMREKAVFALAANRNGRVTARDLAGSLDIPAAEADAFLTEMAKTQPEDVTVEIDDKGGIYYAFPRIMMGDQRARIAPDQARVRVQGVPDTIDAEGLDYDESAPQQRKRTL